MLKGLIIFTSQHDEGKVMDILGFSPVQNSRSRFEYGYRVQKYNVKGSEFYATVIRASDVASRAKRLGQRCGNCPVFIFPASGVRLPPPPPGGGVSQLSCVNDVSSMLGVVSLSPVECNALQQLFDEYEPQGFINPETPGEAETEFANQFFANVAAGRRTRAPDPDLFQGAVFFMPSQGRITIVQNSSSDDDDQTNLQAAIDASMNDDAERSRVRQKRKVPPTWLSVLKEPEPIVAGMPSCITCYSYRASICFVDCGHQVLCDVCVRRMCEIANKACPLCRCESECILRPMVSEIEK